MKSKTILASILLFITISNISWAQDIVPKSDSSDIDFHLYPYLNIGITKSLIPDQQDHGKYSNSSTTDFGYGISFDGFFRSFGIGADFYNNHLKVNSLYDYYTFNFDDGHLYHSNYKDLNMSLFYSYMINYNDVLCFFKFGFGPDYVLYSFTDREKHEIHLPEITTETYKSKSYGYHLNTDFCVDYGYFSVFIGFKYMYSKLGNLKNESNNTDLVDDNYKKVDVTISAKTFRFGVGINI